MQLHKVKFNTNQEYEYVNNFKVLQKTFADHQVDRVIPVERLVKCRFQDNLEFLQWVKKFWDTYYPGGSYDAVGRRKAGGGGASIGVVRKSGSSMSIDKSSPKPAAAAAFRAPAGKPVQSRNAAATVAPRKTDSAVAELNDQITQLQVTVDGLEKERDFYFSKLRDVEILVQTRADSEDKDSATGKFCKEIQSILYSTEEGFEVPAAAEETF